MDNRNSIGEPVEITISRRPGSPAPSPAGHKPVNKPAYTKRKPVQFAAGAAGRVQIIDWLRFASEMRLAVAAGLPLLRALAVVEESDPKKNVRRAASAVRQSLVSGNSFEQALGNATDIPPLVRILADTGNRFGRLDQSFAIIEDHFQWLRDLRSAMLSAFLYPGLIILLGLLIRTSTVLIIATMRGGSAGEAFLSSAVVYWVPTLAAAAAAWILGTLLMLPKVRPVTDRVSLTLPVAGKAIQVYALAVFFRILAAGIRAGIPITSGWQAAAASCPNLSIGQRLNHQLYRLQDGESISDTLRHSGVAGQDALGMAAAGEAVAEVPQLVEVLARQYSAEARHLIIVRLKAVMPFLIIGVGIGFFIYPPLLAAIVFLIVFFRRLV